MIPLKIGKERYWLPQRFGEISVSMILSLQEIDEDPSTFVSKLIGAPENIDVSEVLPMLNWMEDGINLNEYPASTDPDLPDVWEHSLNKKTAAQDLIKLDTGLNIVGDLVSVYLDSKSGEEWNAQPIEVVYPIFLNLLAQIQEVLEAEKNIPRSGITSEQRQAGIHMYDQLGHFNTVDLVAKGDPFKYEGAESLAYKFVFMKMLKTGIDGKFADNYREIIKKQSNDKARTK